MKSIFNKKCTGKRRKILRTGIMLLISGMIFGVSSCYEWGQWDDPAGNQKNPDSSSKVVATFPFDSDLSASDTDITGEPFALGSGENPGIVEDPGRETSVLHLNGGYVRFVNPLQGKSLASGGSLSMWLRMPSTDLEGALFSFIKESSGDDPSEGTVYFTGNAFLNYQGSGGTLKVNDPAKETSNAFTPNSWNFLAIALSSDGFTVYINGEKTFDTNTYQNKTSTGVNGAEFDYRNIADLLTSAPYFYLGYGSSSQTKEFYVDELKIYQNKISEKNAQPDSPILPTPVYKLTFDEAHSAKIVGAGSYIKAEDPFGMVFQNATGGMRQNYLQLPEDILSYSTDTKEMSIGVWVNASDAGASADYMWSPLFTAYGSAPSPGNTWPMMALQYRGVMQVNCAGWCDFTDAQNVKGYNSLYHNDTDWLADRAWHYYTATLTETSTKVYFDGVLVNEWEIDGTEGATINGLFSNGADLKYICLGGNQAWDWGDPDPGFMFDDFVVYNAELTQENIQEIIAAKMPQAPDPVYINTFETGLSDAKIVGTGYLTQVTDAGFGTVFQNVGGILRTNYLLLPENALSHSTETMELSVCVWVNAENAGASGDYMWAPMFTAYGSGPATENTWPMLACQYRGVLQVNCAGWCDFTDAQNVKGISTLYHDATDWLADHKWHLYTATFTETTAKVYFDGVVVNEWIVDGTSDGNVIRGLFTNGADLKYICLGGNQAWGWGDPDPGFMFDDIAIYNVELTPTDIAVIRSNK